MRAGQVVGIFAAVMIAGCGGGSTQMQTRVVEVPRVDMQVEGAGNRGYIQGTAPAPDPMKTTRQIIETNVLLPGMSSDDGSAAASAGVPAQAATSQFQAPGAMPAVAPAAPAGGSEYIVKEGDTLWSIAAAVYGDATYWKDILDANRDQLADADAVRPGMRLRIPEVQRRALTIHDKGGAK